MAVNSRGHLPDLNPMRTSTHIEYLLKRDRAIVISGVVALVAIAWGYTIYIAQSNADMGASMGMAMGNVRSWSATDDIGPEPFDRAG